MKLKSLFGIFFFLGVLSQVFSQTVETESYFVGPNTLATPEDELILNGHYPYPQLNWGDNPAEIQACPYHEVIGMYNLSCTVGSFLAVGFQWANQTNNPETQAMGYEILNSVFEFLNSGKPVSPLNDVWGYDDPHFGNAYALIGAANGLSVVDVTTPSSPREVGYFNGSYSIWRDIKVRGHYAYYVQDDSQSMFKRYTAVDQKYYNMLTPEDGISIVDLSYPNSPQLVAHDTEYFSYAHNLFIEVEPHRPYAWVCGGDITEKGGIGVFSLENPEKPVLIHRWNEVYIHDLVVQYREQDSKYILYGAAIYAKSGEPALWIIDVTDPANPVVISSHASNYEMVHNVWPTTNSEYLYVTHEENGMPVSIWDARDLNNIVEVGELFLTEENNDIACHNVFVRGDRLWASYYSMGTVVYDISAPTKPVLLARYDTFPQFWQNKGNLQGNWGVYPFAAVRRDNDEYYVYSSDITNGLFVTSLASDTLIKQTIINHSDSPDLTWMIGLSFALSVISIVLIGFILYKMYQKTSYSEY